MEKIKDNTERNYHILSKVSGPFLNLIFKPLILNKENLVKDKPIIYTPNHRKTVDSLILFANIPDDIHWVALQRFFTGDDSIFANSKNPLLCKLTPVIFNAAGAVPVVREQDAHLYPNERTINLNMLRRSREYLTRGSSMGIFPEGTTNKNLATGELLEVKPTAFSLAKKYGAYIQPIAMVYRPEGVDLKHKIIINYREPIKLDEMTTEEAIKLWYEEMYKGIEENNAIYEKAKVKIKK